MTARRKANPTAIIVTTATSDQVPVYYVWTAKQAAAYEASEHTDPLQILDELAADAGEELPSFHSIATLMEFLEIKGMELQKPKRGVPHYDYACMAY